MAMAMAKANLLVEVNDRNIVDHSAASHAVDTRVVVLNSGRKKRRRGKKRGRERRKRKGEERREE